MGQLTNLFVSQSYQGLIKLANSTTGVTNTLQYTQDGLGNNLPIQISDTTVNITGSFLVNGLPVQGSIDSGSFATTGSNQFNGNQSISGSVTATSFTGSLQGTSSFAVSSSFATNVLSASFAQNAVTASIAADLFVYGKNNNAGTLSKGTIVRIVGANGNNPLFDTASWTDDANSANTLGMLTTDVAPNAFTNIVTQGTVVGINTNGMTAGAMLYLSSSGQYTTQIPPAPYHEVRLGQVLRPQLNNGSAYISIDNGYELSELHDVDITNPVVGDLLVYTSGSYGQWINATGPEIGLATTGSLTGYTTTTQFNNYTSSNDTKVNDLISKTGSYASQSGVTALSQSIATTDLGQNNRLTALEGVTGSINRNGLITTGSIGVTQGILGDIAITGSLSAYSASITYLTTVYQTSSVIFTSGSNILGDEASDIQVLWGKVMLPTGPLDITGSVRSSGQIRTDNTLIAINGVQTNNISNPGTAGDIIINSSVSKIILEGNTEVTGTLKVTDSITGSLQGTASYATNALSASQAQNSVSSSFATNALSASYAPQDSLPAGVVSGSAQIVELGFATTSSVNQKLDTGSFNTYSGDTLNLINTKLDTGSFNSYTSSNDGKVNDLISKTGSYVTEAESGSFMTTGSVAGNVLTFTKGDGTTFDLTVNTGSGGGTIDTGSFAITGSNRFNGDQIISGSVTMSGSLNLSGSIYMKNQGNTGLDYISQSAANSANFLIGANGSFSTNSGSFVITGSNNFVSAQFPRTVGYINYINGHGNIMLGSAGVLLSTSSIAVNTSANIGGGSMTLNFGTSSLAAPVIGNNQVLASPTFLSPSGSINAINNLFIGTTTYRATGSTHNTLSTMTQNIFNSSPVFNAVSSSIAMANNTFGGGTHTFNNNYTSSNTTGNQMALNRNAIFGNGHVINASGSNDGSTSFGAFNDNLIAGTSNTVNRSAVGTSSGSLVAGALIGNGLIVSSSNRAGGNDAGTIFVGRWNDTAQGLSESTTTIFAVGTGTATGTRRTSLHVSSSGLFQARHDMIISGSMTVTGSAVITGSVQGNVLPLTVTSNTASLNLNNGNFFELALTGSQDIRIEPSNIKPGQTVNIKLNTTGSGTVSFPTTVKQVSGSSYTPTTAVSTDIITMVSFDSTNLYLANVKNLV